MVGGEREDKGREAAWAVITTLVLATRIVATLALVLLVLGWAVASVRDSVHNLFLWPCVVVGAVLLVSTYLYSLLRARHPRRNGWIP